MAERSTGIDANLGCRQGRIRAQQPGAYHCLSVCLSLSVGRWYRDTVRINKYPPCSVLQQPVRAALSACRQVSRRSTTAFAGVRLVGDAIVTGSASRTDRIGLASRRLADARPLRPRVPSVHAAFGERRAAERMGGVPARAKRSARGATVHHIRVVPPQCPARASSARQAAKVHSTWQAPS